MPKPKSKKELTVQSRQNYKRLIDLVNNCIDEGLDKEFPKGTLNRNIKDVLAHLHHWHLMMLDWYTVGMTGAKPDMPAKGYSWKMLPELNLEIWKQYQKADLETTLRLLDKSFEKMQNIIKKHSDEELFTKKKYSWTGSTSLGVYLIANTSSHFDWAYKLIKKSLNL